MHMKNSASIHTTHGCRWVGGLMEKRSAGFRVNKFHHCSLWGDSALMLPLPVDRLNSNDRSKFDVEWFFKKGFPFLKWLEPYMYILFSL